MTITRKEGRVQALSAPLEVVTFDIYRDIHKGIRAELFDITTAAGNLDPHDEAAVHALDERFRALTALLEGHAAHEDRYLAPLIRRRSRSLADAIALDHDALEAQLRELGAAREHRPATKNARRLDAHRFYLGVASFTSAYLEHQAAEELDVMPVLATGYTLEELIGVNAAIIGEIPPDTMTATLSLLLPAMNVEDRIEMLSGMRAAAPAQAFAGILSLARSVLPSSDYAVLEEAVA